MSKKLCLGFIFYSCVHTSILFSSASNNPGLSEKIETLSTRLAQVVVFRDALLLKVEQLENCDLSCDPSDINRTKARMAVHNCTIAQLTRELNELLGKPANS